MNGMGGDAPIEQFMPHGMCFLWDARMLALHVISDATIALAYFSIPLILLFFIRKRRDLPFRAVFAMFGLFIVACGTTHVLDIWTIWHPTYWLSGIVKAMTACVSLATAVLLVRVVPGALTIKSRADLAEELAATAQRDRATALSLHKKNELLTRAEEMAHVGHWRLDAQSKELFWSEEMYRIHGLPRAETVTDELGASFCHRDDRENVRAAIERGIVAATPFALEYRIVRRDGATRDLIARVNPECLLEGTTSDLVGVVQDVTEAKDSEHERLRLLDEGTRAQSQLRQAQKMEAVGQLTGGVAHDFNNLLAIILGNLELLGDQKNVAPLDVECLEDARRAAQRGAELTRRLLVFSRQQQLAPSAVDVGVLLETLIRMLRRVVEESIVIETRIAPNLWTPWIDPQQLESALLNLVINARDAMPDGGILAIAAENVVLDEPELRLYAESAAPGRYLVLSVADNGSGMAKDVLERVFEPFFTTKPIGGGTGLGLSMVYGFIKQSGGFVTIYSEPGFGTTVKVYLSELHAQSASVAPPVEDAPARSALRSGRVVLVVEDDFSVRKLQLRVLNSLGYQTLEASDGPSGLAALGGAAHIDMLLTDIVLPGGMNGPALADAARRMRPDLKVLFMSGHAPTNVTQRYDLSGAHLLSKPFSRATLAHAVHELLEGETVA